MSETEYGFKLQIKKGSVSKVEIEGYCSEVDKQRLLSVALKTYDTEIRPFVGLTLEEIEDIEAALKNKNDGSK